MTDHALFWVAVALAGVAGSALFSGLETAAYVVNRVRLHVASRTGRGVQASRARRLLSELEPQDRLLASLLIANNAANYVGALGVSAVLTRSGLSDWGVVAVNAIVLTPLLFIFGETLPKDLFRASADSVMPRCAAVLTVLRWAMTATGLLPLVRLFGAGVSRLVGVRDAAAVSTARARLLALLKEGARFGALSESQAELVERAGLLRQRAVADVMTPWTRVATLGVDWSREQIERALRRAPHRSAPVVDRRGRVVGMVETARVWLEPDTPISTLAEPAPTLDASSTLADALVELRRAGARRAIVMSRGAPAGLVAERDLLTPLLGHIGRT